MSVVCLECSAENRETERNCAKCSTSLRPALAQLHLVRAEADMNKGRYQQAGKNMAKADAEMLLISSEERNRYMLSAWAFWLQGSIYFYKGMMPEAEQELLLAQSNLGQIEGAALLALVLNRLAHVTNFEGRYEESIDYLRESSKQALRAGDYNAAAKATANLGIVFDDQGNVEEAAALYLQALGYAEIGGDAVALAPTYRLLADHYAANGPFSRAVEYADKGLALASQLDDLYIRALCFADAANIYMRYGDIDKAVHYLHESYELTRRSDNKLAIEAVMLNIAELMRYEEYTEHHAPWIEGALADFTETLASSLSKGPYALQMSYYYIRRQDWGHLHRLSYQLKQVNTATLLPVEALQISAARCLIHAALGEWEQAAEHYTITVSSGKLSRYERAVIHEDYARMLLRYSELTADSASKETARNALEQAASLYRELDLPRRTEAVEARLAAIS